MLPRAQLCPNGPGIDGFFASDLALLGKPWQHAEVIVLKASRSSIGGMLKPSGGVSWVMAINLQQKRLIHLCEVLHVLCAHPIRGDHVSLLHDVAVSTRAFSTIRVTISTLDSILKHPLHVCTLIQNQSGWASRRLCSTCWAF